MTIQLDDLSGPEIQQLLRAHLRTLAEVSPPESCHALDIESLKKPPVTFWSIWQNAELVGCGALKKLTDQHAEIKSMRTADAHLRKGVARTMLQHLIQEAKQRGFTRLSLETGSMAYFAPARELYASVGFTKCAPFSTYREDPNSTFMTKEL